MSVSDAELGYVPRLQYRGRVRMDPRADAALRDMQQDDAGEIDPAALHEAIAPFVAEFTAFAEKLELYRTKIKELDRQNAPWRELSLHQKDVNDLRDSLWTIWKTASRIDNIDALIQVFLIESKEGKR